MSPTMRLIVLWVRRRIPHRARIGRHRFADCSIRSRLTFDDNSDEQQQQPQPEPQAMPARLWKALISTPEGFAYVRGFVLQRDKVREQLRHGLQEQCCGSCFAPRAGPRCSGVLWALLAPMARSV